MFRVSRSGLRWVRSVCEPCAVSAFNDASHCGQVGTNYAAEAFAAPADAAEALASVSRPLQLPQPLRGQLGTVSLFREALTKEYINAIWQKGPNFDVAQAVMAYLQSPVGL
eukprot:5952396-Pleurochrysis_carterae.AAC.3